MHASPPATPSLFHISDFFFNIEFVWSPPVLFRYTLHVHLNLCRKRSKFSCRRPIFLHLSHDGRLLMCKVEQVFQGIQYRSEIIISAIHSRLLPLLAALLEICESLCPKSSQLRNVLSSWPILLFRPIQSRFIQSVKTQRLYRMFD